MRYTLPVMINSFICKETKDVWNGIRSKRLPSDIQNIARRKLRMLNAAKTLRDLRIPPNNRLEKLSGNRAHQHSIRINKQWRIYFEWIDGGVDNVGIIDYH